MRLKPVYPPGDNTVICEKCNTQITCNEAFADLDGKPFKSYICKDCLIKIWVKLGKDNPWIKHSWDPEFNEKSFYECKTIEELKEKFIHGNWCLGSAFFYQNLCFINQVNGGDEWLTIRDDISFESCSMGFIIRNNTEKFENLIQRFLDATPEQLKNRKY